VDMGRSVRVRVAATSGGTTASAVSGETSEIQGVPASGHVVVTATVSSNNSFAIADYDGFDPWPMGTTTVEMKRCDEHGDACVVASSSGNVVPISRSDVGLSIRATVTVTNNLGTATVTSEPAVVRLDLPVATAPPTIELHDGFAVSTPGTWTGDPVEY